MIADLRGCARGIRLSVAARPPPPDPRRRALRACARDSCAAPAAQGIRQNPAAVCRRANRFAWKKGWPGLGLLANLLLLGDYYNVKTQGAAGRASGPRGGGYRDRGGGDGVSGPARGVARPGLAAVR